MNNIVLSFIVNMFTVNSAIHNYNTRQKNNLHVPVPSYRIKVREHGVRVCDVKIWNNIPEELKELRTCDQFRLKCKRYLLS